jgi:hypothetical protein
MIESKGECKKIRICTGKVKARGLTFSGAILYLAHVLK